MYFCSVSLLLLIVAVYVYGQGVYPYYEVLIDSGVTDAYDIFATDIDGDGDGDFLATSTYKNAIYWFENLGGGINPKNFKRYDIDTNSQLPAEVFGVDLNGDRKVDVLSASKNDNTIAWYKNDGLQNFTKNIVDDKFSLAFSVYATDIDNDGDMDIIAGGGARTTCGISWYENDGDESFSKHEIDSTTKGPCNVFAIDIDKDGDSDVLYTGAQDNTVGWFENNGDGSSFVNHIITSSLPYTLKVYAIDLDKDGDIDVLSVSSKDYTVVWFENDGQQNFTQILIGDEVTGAQDVFAIDVDNDGDIDVVSAESINGYVIYFENDGNQHFLRKDFGHVHGPMSVYAMDLDNDSNVDILSASMYDNSVNIFTTNPSRNLR